MHGDGEAFDDGAADDGAEGRAFDGVGGVGREADGEAVGRGGGVGAGCEHGGEAVAHFSERNDFAERDGADGTLRQEAARDGGQAGNVADGGDAGR